MLVPVIVQGLILGVLGLAMVVFATLLAGRHIHIEPGPPATRIPY
jgi:hypothetical protein